MQSGPKSQPELVVFVTTPSREQAIAIAEHIVNDRLAACVNIVPAIDSIYRWEGKIARDAESLMIIKTTADSYEALEKRVIELHSYDTPEVIALMIDRGAEKYLNWLRIESGPSASEKIE
jgi:periplasmic divalent cation tolerance protein